MGVFFSRDLTEELRVSLILYDGYFFSKFTDLLVSRGMVDRYGASYFAAGKLFDMGVRTKTIRSLRLPDYSHASKHCLWVRSSLLA